MGRPQGERAPDPDPVICVICVICGLKDGRPALVSGAGVWYTGHAVATGFATTFPIPHPVTAMADSLDYDASQWHSSGANAGRPRRLTRETIEDVPRPLLCSFVPILGPSGL